MTEKLKLDWSSAEVSDETLIVPLSATPPKGWRQAFEQTCALLHSGRESVTVHPRRATIEVSPVAAGDEERLHGLLEGAALQANATLVDDDELYDRPLDEDEDADASDDSAEADESRSPDEELSTRFRAFGGDDDDADENGSDG